MDLKLGEGRFNIIVDIVNSGLSKIAVEVASHAWIMSAVVWKISSHGGERSLCDFMSTMHWKFLSATLLQKQQLSVQNEVCRGRSERPCGQPTDQQKATDSHTNETK